MMSDLQKLSIGCAVLPDKQSNHAHNKMDPILDISRNNLRQNYFNNNRTSKCDQNLLLRQHRLKSCMILIITVQYIERFD